MSSKLEFCSWDGRGGGGRGADLGQVRIETLREAAHARVGLVEQRIHLVGRGAGAQRQRHLQHASLPIHAEGDRLSQPDMVSVPHIVGIAGGRIVSHCQPLFPRQWRPSGIL
ncbi:MAG: hypothetical protein ACHQ1E_14710 [Ktedonobacterales bacterium]